MIAVMRTSMMRRRRVIAKMKLKLNMATTLLVCVMIPLATTTSIVFLAMTAGITLMWRKIRIVTLTRLCSTEGVADKQINPHIYIYIYISTSEL